VQLLLKDGITQEFFIEGTRSRTGKTLQPRFGMLRMVLEAFDHGVRRDVSLVPVGFTYERLIEEGSMTQERGGGAKGKENLFQLIRSGSILKSRFGAVNLRFGEPISLAAQPDLDPRRIADEVSRRLNSLVTVGRSSVSSAALLGGPARAIRVSELEERVREVSGLLECMGMPRMEGLEQALQSGKPGSAVDLLLQGGLVERLPRATGDLVSFSERTRDALVYYRTTISPALVWPAVLGLTLPLARRRVDALRECCEWLELLRLEYFPPDWSEREVLLSKLIDHMIKRGWVSENGDGELRVSDEGGDWLEFLATQIAPVIETYRALFSAVAGMTTGRARKQLLADAQTALEDQLLLGEARHSESVCPITLGNALQLLIEERIVSADGNPRSADTVFEPGLQFVKLRAFEERISTAV
jgi:glycerol-3-phosphate O-acyltransferase